MQKAGFAFVRIVLKGFGQIMLQENEVTGLFFLAGVFWGSFTMGIAAIVAVCSSTLVAKLLSFDHSEVEKGLVGFSPALVGVALILFFKPVLIVWVFVIIGSIVAALLQHGFIVKKLPVFTLPFVLVTWIIVVFLRAGIPFQIPFNSTGGLLVGGTSTFIFKGFGQVIFQDNLVSGILFFLGVFINSPVAALYGLAGSFIAGAYAYWLSAPVADIIIGVYSFNAVLCAIVFSGKKVQDGVWAFIAVVFSVMIGIVMEQNNLYQLTFPFVAATWICLALKRLVFITPIRRGVK